MIGGDYRRHIVGDLADMREITHLWYSK